MAPLKSPKNNVKIKVVKKNKRKPARKTNFSTQTGQSKQAVHRNDDKDISSPLSVAITCNQTGILWKEESEEILTAIQKRIIVEASSTNLDTPRPTFNSQPLFEEGVLKLWCDNDHTLAWLKNTVSGLNCPSVSPVVKSQLEIKKRVRCGFQIPDEQGVFKELADIGRAVCYQNPWVVVGRWELIYAGLSDNGTWSLRVGVPEDQIPTLLKAGRRLSIGLKVVQIFFKGPNGKYNADVPQGWDPATETIVQQPIISSNPKRFQRPTVYPFVIMSDEQDLQKKQKNNVGT